eukprot:Pgem_evm1s13684
MQSHCRPSKNTLKIFIQKRKRKQNRESWLKMKIYKKTEFAKEHGSAIATTLCLAKPYYVTIAGKETDEIKESIRFQRLKLEMSHCKIENKNKVSKPSYNASGSLAYIETHDPPYKDNFAIGMMAYAFFIDKSLHEDLRNHA